MQKFLVLDYETRSEADLKLVGSYEYATHPTTEIICASWAIGTKEELPTAKVHSWSDFSPTENDRTDFALMLTRSDLIIVAHNALFEQVITDNVLFRGCEARGSLPPSRWICTAARASALALPRDLEDACAALRLPIQKDVEGRKLILKYCKPRRETLHNKAKWHSDPEELKRIVQYCENDIKAEIGLFLATPSLNPVEKKVWEMDQRMNLRGIRVDRELVKSTLDLVETETDRLTEETKRITNGAVNTVAELAKVHAFIQSRGGTLPDLTAKTVKDTIAAKTLEPVSHRLLEIRRDASKTSTAKYHALFNQTQSDGRIRDYLMYHGASTGRWTGRGAQLHNLPRPDIKDTRLSIELCKQRDLDSLSLFYGNPMNVFASNLRGCLLPSPGFELFCGDYSAIEVRVLFWLAGHDDGINAYHEGRDLYREMASKIYRVPLKEVTSPQREVGKRAILGCGYGMGPPKFEETCKAFGQEVTTDLAELAVKTYREVHHPVPAFWKAVEATAIAAVRNPGKRYQTNKTIWWTEKNFLWCQLPSGRRLAFYGSEVRFKATPWGEKRPTLYHWAVDSKTYQWACGHTYGGKLVENITQAVARDFMAEAMLRLDNSDYPVLLSVHDEILAEREIGTGNLKEFTDLMVIVPEWGYGCPIKADTWGPGERYKK